MKNVLFILFCFLFFSCVNDQYSNKSNKKDIQSSVSEDIVIGFSVTSKNSKLTSKTGIDVSTNEMITKNVNIGDNILFKNFQFTLDNRIEGAFNFYSSKGKLMCHVPTEVSIRSMPPDGTGLTTYNKDESIEFSGMSLIKIQSINFVISDIRFNNNVID